MTFTIFTLNITTLGIMTLSIMRNTIANWAHSQVTNKISVMNTNSLHNLQIDPISYNDTLHWDEMLVRRKHSCLLGPL
jgi:hypothetical protein